MTKADRRISARAEAPHHGDRLLFPDCGITQSDVAEYYRRVAPKMLPYLQGRPLAVSCYPHGITGEEARLDLAHWPEQQASVDVPAEPPMPAQRWPMANDVDALELLAALGAVDLKTWLSRTTDLHYPDQLVFDLTPAGQSFDAVKTAAAVLADLLEDLGMKAYPMLTGSRGLHLRIPLDGQADFGMTRALGRRVARSMALQDPERYTAEKIPERRGSRLFINYLLNDYGQLVIAPYSLRAQPGAPVAAPLTWDALADPDLSARSCRRAAVLAELAADNPWADFDREGYSVTAAHEHLDRSANTV